MIFSIISKISSFFINIIQNSKDIILKRNKCIDYKENDKSKYSKKVYKKVYKECKQCGIIIKKDMIVYFAMDKEYCSDDCRVVNVV
jgi:formamidopyrimidine-DNA glycosylase